MNPVSHYISLKLHPLRPRWIISRQFNAKRRRATQYTH